jgi:acyl carrier protein
LTPEDTIARYQANLSIGGARMTDQDEVYNKVKAIIVDLLGVDENKVTMEARFREDLEADSLDLVELIMKFEDEFGGEISDKEAQEIKTVGQAVDYLQTHAK